MNYTPTIVCVDDNPRILENFLDISESYKIQMKNFETWDLAEEYLETNFNLIHGIILDAKGKLTADRQESEAHLSKAINWISKKEGQGIIIPYAIHTAFYESLEAFSEQKEAGKMFSKNSNSEKRVLDYIKAEIENLPNIKIIKKYHEPFCCFGGKYLDKMYEEFLLGIVKILDSKEITNPEKFLFNPCRILLENVFKKITEVDERILPYELLNFDDQRVGLSNCSKYLSGITVYINKRPMQRSAFIKDHISKQLQTIITICHPASHDIQNYSQYTFKSVLWALFDILIWLKKFIDERK